MKQIRSLGVPWKKQWDTYSCGAISAQMVIRYLGIKASLSEVQEAAKTTQENGTSQYGILKALRYFGLSASYRQDQTITNLADWMFEHEVAPIIYFKKRIKRNQSIFDSEDHWCVVNGIWRGNVYLRDPSILYTLRPWSDSNMTFRKRWDRSAIYAWGGR